MRVNDTFCTDYNAAFTYVSDFYTREIQDRNSNVQHGKYLLNKIERFKNIDKKHKDVLFAEILKLPDAVM